MTNFSKSLEIVPNNFADALVLPKKEPKTGVEDNKSALGVISQTKNEVAVNVSSIDARRPKLFQSQNDTQVAALNANANATGVASASKEESAEPKTDELNVDAQIKNPENSADNTNGGAIKEFKNLFSVVSKSATYNGLQIAKDHEVQDGVFKAAEGVARTGALGAFIIGIVNTVGVRKLYMKHYDKAQGIIVDTGEGIAKDFAKIAKKSKKGGKMLGLSLIFIGISSCITQVNKFFADKTANKRGFKSTAELERVSGYKNYCDAIDNAYAEKTN